MMKKLIVVGLGNRYRGDDAFGLEVIRRLKKDFRKHTLKEQRLVEIKEWEEDFMQLLCLCKDAEGLIIVDAIYPIDGYIGKIYWGSWEELNERIKASASTHSISIKEILEIYRALYSLPSLFLFYGVVGKNFNMGERVSWEVKKAEKVVVRMLKDKIYQICSN